MSDRPIDGKDHPMDDEDRPKYNPYDDIDPSWLTGVTFYSSETGGYPPQPDPCSKDEVITVCQDMEIPPRFNGKYWDNDSRDDGKYWDDDSWDNEIPPPFTRNYSDDDSVDSADSPVQGVPTFGLPRCNTIAQGKEKSRKSEERQGSLDAYHPNAQGETMMKKSINEDHQQWIDSWYKGTDPPPQVDNIVEHYCVWTDGYHRKGRKGGYGVIIREDYGGKPIVASAVAATEVVSLLYHQLQGLLRGVELAMEYNMRDIELFCNAKSVVRLVKRVLQTKCFFHAGKPNSSDVLCEHCVKDLTSKEEYPLVLPLLKRIAELEEPIENFYLPIEVQKCERERNKAAGYLAKNGAPGMEKLSPCNFPDELKEILCKDYFGMPF